MGANLFALIESRFPADREEPCLMHPGGGAVTYRMLDAQSARLANLLVESGCVKGDRVAAQVEKSSTSLALYLACLRAGLVYLPLNTGYQAREIAYFLGDAKPRAVVCAPSAKESIAAAAPEGASVFTLDELGAGSLVDAAGRFGDSFRTVDVAPDDLASIQHYVRQRARETAAPAATQSPRSTRLIIATPR